MADDKDDGIAKLLDEVERKYLSPQATPTSGLVAKATTGSGLIRHGCGKLGADCGTVDTRPTNDVIDNEEIDEIIQEIINEPDDLVSQRERGRRRRRRIDPSINIPTTTSQPLRPGKRCFPLLLAGTALTLGYSNSVTNRACDQLRCTSCDFHVILFDDRVWTSHCDQLFLRNNMPDREKLRPSLVNRKGWRAYACQCSWHSVREVEEVRRGGGGGGGGGGVDIKSLKWVCGKH